MPKLRQPPKPPESDAPKPHENAEPEDELFEAAPPEAEVVEPVKPAAPPPTPEPPKDDNALQKQIEALKKSEAVAKQERDSARQNAEEARKRAIEREVEIAKFQKEATQSKTDSIASGIAAANAEAETAQKDIENAVSIGDVKAQAEAYRRLAKAETALARLEDGKSALEEEAKRIEVAPKPQPPVDDPIERILQNANMPTIAKNWLRAHPEYITDAKKNAKINSLHFEVIDEGHEAYSPAYIESMETHLGMREVPKKNEQEIPEDETPPQRSSIVSAPPSREVPTGKLPQRKGIANLTPAQREAAKWAGITEVEYAKQLEKMNEMKANGQIQN